MSVEGECTVLSLSHFVEIRGREEECEMVLWETLPCGRSWVRQHPIELLSYFWRYRQPCTREIKKRSHHNYCLHIAFRN